MNILGTVDWKITTAQRRIKANRKRLIPDDEYQPVANTLWMAVQLVPARITLALDFPNSDDGPLEGDWVDRVLGVPVGHVDQYEAGVRYPTWNALENMRWLTGKSWSFWFKPVLSADETSMRWHTRRGESLPPRPVNGFRHGAIGQPTRYWNG